MNIDGICGCKAQTIYVIGLDRKTGGRNLLVLINGFESHFLGLAVWYDFINNTPEDASMYLLNRSSSQRVLVSGRYD